MGVKAEDRDKWINHSPRVKMALRLYGSGAAHTQEEAARIAGCNRYWLSQARQLPAGRALMDEIEQGLQKKTIGLSAVVSALSHQALAKVAQLMDKGSTEAIQLNAATTILDRNPETSKSNRLQVESFTLSGRDAKGLADAMVEAARVHEEFKNEVAGDFVRVDGVQEAQAASSESAGLAIVK